MKPRSFTPLCRTRRSSSRSTAWRNVACETANARWCTAPCSVDVRVESGVRSSLVNTVISRPSPGSKYRWLSDSLSRFGCSNTNGIPRTPSQKSIEVCRSAPTIVVWCTPCTWSLRTRSTLMLDEPRFVLAAAQAAERHELDARLHDERAADAVADRGRELLVAARPARELDADRKRRL